MGELPRVVYEEDAAPENATVLLDKTSVPITPNQRPCLVVVGGRESVGRVLPLKNGITLGRAVSCDVVLEEEGVSRRHARFEVGTDGQVTIEDLGSSNGILSDGERISGRTLVREGQRFSIGNAVVCLLKFDDFDEAIFRNLVGSATEDRDTRLPVRRAFLEAVAREHRYAVRYKSPLALILFAVDQYLSLCDELGANVGPFMLRRLASTITSLARENAFVGRYAEDQVAVLLPDTSLGDAKSIAEWIRRTVESTKLTFNENAALQITVSGGITSTEIVTSSTEHLLESVERGLYRAKINGHNRTEV